MKQMKKNSIISHIYFFLIALLLIMTGYCTNENKNDDDVIEKAYENNNKIETTEKQSDKVKNTVTQNKNIDEQVNPEEKKDNIEKNTGTTIEKKSIDNSKHKPKKKPDKHNENEKQEISSKELVKQGIKTKEQNSETVKTKIQKKSDTANQNDNTKPEQKQATYKQWMPDKNIRYIKKIKVEFKTFPSKKAKIRMYLLKGYAVQHIEDIKTNPNAKKSNWAEVKYKETVGYVPAYALSRDRVEFVTDSGLKDDTSARYVINDDVILFSNTKAPLRPIQDIPQHNLILVLDSIAGESFSNMYKEFREWSRVQYKDTVGYVIKSSLSRKEPKWVKEIVPIVHKGEQNLKTKIDTPVYELPGSESSIAMTLPKGVYIKDWYHTDYIYEYIDDNDYSYWRLVSYKGIKGYCKPDVFDELNWLEEMYAEADWSGFTNEEIERLKKMIAFVGYNMNAKEFVNEARERKKKGETLFFTKNDIDFDKPMEMRKEAYMLNRPNWNGKPIILVPKTALIKIETDVNYWQERDQSYMWMFAEYKNKTGYIPNMYMGEIPTDEPLTIGEERLRKLCYYYAEIVYKLYDKYRSFDEAVYNAYIIMKYSYEKASHLLAVDGINYIYKVWQKNMTGMPVKYYFKATWNVLEWAIMNKKTKAEMIETFEEMTEVFSRQRKYDFVSAFSDIITGKADIQSRLSTLKDAFVL